MTYINPLACVEKDVILGLGTRVHAFVHILSGAKIGHDCNICDYVFIESHAIIGDLVTIKCGVQVWDNIIIEDNVFVGPNVTFTNDKYPPDKDWPKNRLTTRVRKGAKLGAASVILPGIVIGENAMIGAGSVVTRDVPDNALVYGNPARIIKYIINEQFSSTEQ